MPMLYSLDLRWRVIWMHIAHQTTRARTAQLLGLSECTVRKYLALFGYSGDIEAEPHRNGSQILLGDHEQLLILRLIISNPDRVIFSGGWAGGSFPPKHTNFSPKH